MFTLLIVEDESLERRALRKMISSAFDNVRLLPTATTGTDGLKYIRQFRPDIVILDIQMPGMDGIEVLKTLHAEEFLGAVIISTAHDEFSFAKDALNCGAIAFLLKPSSPADVQNAVMKAMEHIGSVRKDRRAERQNALSIKQMSSFILCEALLKIVNFEKVDGDMIRRLEEMNIGSESGFFATVEIPSSEQKKHALDANAQKELIQNARSVVRGCIAPDLWSFVSPAKENCFWVFVSSRELKSTLYYRYMVGELSACIQQTVYDKLRIRVRIGFGNVKDSFRSYLQSYIESVQALFKTGDQNAVGIQEASYLCEYQAVIEGIESLDFTLPNHIVASQLQRILESAFFYWQRMPENERRGLAVVI